MELLQTLEYNDLKVELYYAGGRRIPNKVFLENVLVYEESADNSGTFTLGSMYENSYDDPKVMAAYLGFLTLQPQDVEEDFFIERNCPVLDKWAEESETAQELRMMCYDYDMKDDEEYLKINEMSEEYATRLEKLIKI